MVQEYDLYIKKKKYTQNIYNSDYNYIYHIRKIQIQKTIQTMIA